eukprot:UN13241
MYDFVRNVGGASNDPDICTEETRQLSKCYDSCAALGIRLLVLYQPSRNNPPPSRVGPPSYLQSCQGNLVKIGGFRVFFANIFLLVCRMVTIFLLTQTASLSRPFRYLEHVRHANRKFSRGV